MDLAALKAKHAEQLQQLKEKTKPLPPVSAAPRTPETPTKSVVNSTQKIGPSIAFEDPPNPDMGFSMAAAQKSLNDPAFNVPQGRNVVINLDAALARNKKLTKKQASTEISEVEVPGDDVISRWERAIRDYIGRHPSWMDAIRKQFSAMKWPHPQKLPSDAWARALGSVTNVFMAGGNPRLRRGIEWALSSGKTWNAAGLSTFLLTLEFQRALTENY